MHRYSTDPRQMAGVHRYYTDARQRFWDHHFDHRPVCTYTGLILGIVLGSNTFILDGVHRYYTDLWQKVGEQHFYLR